MNLLEVKPDDINEVLVLYSKQLVVTNRLIKQLQEAERIITELNEKLKEKDQKNG